MATVVLAGAGRTGSVGTGAFRTAPPFVMVNERPSLRLGVHVVTPAGVNARWAADDPNPANQPQTLTLQTEMPGGFSQMTCTLQRDPSLDYSDIEELSMVTVYGAGGEVAWQGRQEALPDTGGSQAQLSPQCAGWQNHLQDNNAAAMIYVDQDLTNWGDPPLDRQIAFGTSYTLGSESTGANTAGNPALILEFDGPWQTALPIAEAWYDSAMAGPVAMVWFSYAPGAQITGGPNWAMEIKGTNSDSGSAINTQTLTATGQSGWFDNTGGTRWVFVQQLYGAANVGNDVAYQSYWQLAVVGNHGLTFYGGTSTTPGGLLASDIIGHAVQTWAPLLNFTTGTNGTIQPSSFVINQIAFTTPTTAAAIIKQAVQYELLDWAVWEGPTFYLNAFGEGATAKSWRSRVGECQLQETGPDISRIYNGVIVQYTLPDGTNGSVGPPGSNAIATSSSLVDTDSSNPANQAGISRYYVLQMGTSVPTDAVQAGAIFLQTQKTLNTSGQASLVGHVQDNNGIWWPAWMVRAGDTLTVVDAKDTSARRIVSTSYDDTSKTNAVQLDQPPDTEDALLQRMSEAISVLGLT